MRTSITVCLAPALCCLVAACSTGAAKTSAAPVPPDAAAHQTKANLTQTLNVNRPSTMTGCR